MISVGKFSPPLRQTRHVRGHGWNLFEQNLHRVAGNLDKGLFLIVLVQLLVTRGALVLPPIAPCVAEGFGVDAYVLGYQGSLFSWSPRI